MQFSLASLFLITTLVAVCLGAFLIAPGLGIFLAVIATPALARTFAAGYRKKRQGIPLTAGQKVSAFLLSFFLVWAIVTAGQVAFFFVCLGTGLAGLAVGGRDWVILAAVGAGGVAGLALIGCLLWTSWPRSA